MSSRPQLRKPLLYVSVLVTNPRGRHTDTQHDILTTSDPHLHSFMEGRKSEYVCDDATIARLACGCYFVVRHDAALGH